MTVVSAHRPRAGPNRRHSTPSSSAKSWRPELPDEPRRAVRRDLRALGVQVVRIQTLPEKLSFDLKWFVVEAGKPVQIVLFNPDAMPHNLIVSRPGSLEAVGTAGGAMPMPTDPDAKAFVPDSPAVLFSTKLVKEGETERLGFTAPKEPGEYVYRLHLSRALGPHVRRHARRRQPRRVGSEADRADRSDDQAAVHLEAALTRRTGPTVTPLHLLSCTA